jgi:hypothetical protein
MSVRSENPRVAALTDSLQADLRAEGIVISGEGAEEGLGS